MEREDEHMNIKMRMLVCVLVFMMISTITQIFPIEVKADTLISGDYEYIVNGSDATIIGYHGSATNLNIPSSLEEYTVVAISPGAFNGCDTLA